METQNKSRITVETIINAPIEKVWAYWTEPEHIMQWGHASEDWHAPYADNDLRTGGKFKTTMAAKDGSMSFDFGGTYSSVVKHHAIAYVLGDQREVEIVFSKEGNAIKVVEVFDAENTHSIEMQQGGWQAILNNFKKYTEAGI